jgi:hypothetical protein
MIKIRHDAIDQLATAGSGGGGALSEEAKQIACRLYRLRLVRGGRSGEQILKIRLSRAQCDLVGFDFGPQTLRSVAFWAAIPRCVSRLVGYQP